MPVSVLIYIFYGNGFEVAIELPLYLKLGWKPEMGLKDKLASTKNEEESQDSRPTIDFDWRFLGDIARQSRLPDGNRKLNYCGNCFLSTLFTTS